VNITRTRNTAVAGYSHYQRLPFPTLDEIVALSRVLHQKLVAGTAMPGFSMGRK
jgi:hypothetical protein